MPSKQEALYTTNLPWTKKGGPPPKATYTHMYPAKAQRRPCPSGLRGEKVKAAKPPNQPTLHLPSLSPHMPPNRPTLHHPTPLQLASPRPPNGPTLHRPTRLPSTSQPASQLTYPAPPTRLLPRDLPLDFVSNPPARDFPTSLPCTHPTPSSQPANQGLPGRPTLHRPAHWQNA